MKHKDPKKSKPGGPRKIDRDAGWRITLLEVAIFDTKGRAVILHGDPALDLIHSNDMEAPANWIESLWERMESEKRPFVYLHGKGRKPSMFSS